MNSGPKDASQLKSLVLYSSPAHACHYLPRRVAVTHFTDPTYPMSTALYSQLADLGFRRSGEYVYRPHCPSCNDCIPIRIPVSDFRPTRCQRRTRKHNQDIEITAVKADFHQEHFDLYQRYILARHPEGDMEPDAAQYKGFLTSSWCDTLLYEFRLDGQLLAVAVVDVLTHGLSAVYTFYDPARPQRSLGVHAILFEISEAGRLGLPWLYLGYWIEKSCKMNYKTRYRPAEIFQENRWLRI